MSCNSVVHVDVRKEAAPNGSVTFTRSQLKTVMDYAWKGCSMFIDSVREAKAHAKTAIDRAGGLESIDLMSSPVVNLFKAHGALMRSRKPAKTTHLQNFILRATDAREMDGGDSDDEIVSSPKPAKRAMTAEDASRMLARDTIHNTESDKILQQIQNRQTTVMNEIFTLTAEWKTLEETATTIKRMMNFPH